MNSDHDNEETTSLFDAISIERNVTVARNNYERLFDAHLLLNQQQASLMESHKKVLEDFHKLELSAAFAKKKRESSGSSTMLAQLIMLKQSQSKLNYTLNKSSVQKQLARQKRFMKKQMNSCEEEEPKINNEFESTSQNVHSTMEVEVVDQNNCGMFRDQESNMKQDLKILFSTVAYSLENYPLPQLKSCIGALINQFHSLPISSRLHLIESTACQWNKQLENEAKELQNDLKELDELRKHIQYQKDLEIKCKDIQK